MSIPREPGPAKLVVSLLLKEKHLFPEAAVALSQSLGRVDMVSRWMPFDKTDYYAPEMGHPLFRRLVAFSRLIEQSSLVDIKLLTNALETEYSRHGKRLINIDPGYLSAERFVLATGKNFTHRIHLRAGIYADLTLIYHKGAFRRLDWTYPDYGGEEIIAFLTNVRQRYLHQLRG